VSGPGGNVTFTYDGDDQRVAQQVESVASKFVNDPVGLSNVLREEGPGGNINLVQGRSLISAVTSQSSLHVSRDASGNIVTVSDANGALSANYAYDPWGNLLNPADPLGTGLRYKFAGEAFDTATGLYYMRARYYDPSTGTFLSKDPLGLRSSGAPDGNVYTYARNNPLRFSDPSGLAAEKSAKRDTAEATYPPDWTNIDPQTKNAIDTIMQELGSREAWLHIHDGKMAIYGLTPEMEAVLRAGGISVQVGTAFLDADVAAGFLAWLRAKNGNGIGFGSPGRGSSNQEILDGSGDERMFRPPAPAKLADPSKYRAPQKDPCAGRGSSAAC
jgi:RHS repeat-associated protein